MDARWYNIHRLGDLILFLALCPAIVSVKTVPVGAGAVFIMLPDHSSERRSPILIDRD